MGILSEADGRGMYLWGNSIAGWIEGICLSDHVCFDLYNLCSEVCFVIWNLFLCPVFPFSSSTFLIGINRKDIDLVGTKFKLREERHGEMTHLWFSETSMFYWEMGGRRVEGRRWGIINVPGPNTFQKYPEKDNLLWIASSLNDIPTYCIDVLMLCCSNIQRKMINSLCLFGIWGLRETLASNSSKLADVAVSSVVLFLSFHPVNGGDFGAFPGAPHVYVKSNLHGLEQN